MPKQQELESNRAVPESGLGFVATEARLLVPKTGYNLVGPDNFQPPTGDLYLLGHYATRAEAEAARKAMRRCGTRAVVYGPEDL